MDPETVRELAQWAAAQIDEDLGTKGISWDRIFHPVGRKLMAGSQEMAVVVYGRRGVTVRVNHGIDMRLLRSEIDEAEHG